MGCQFGCGLQSVHGFADSFNKGSITSDELNSKQFFWTACSLVASSYFLLNMIKPTKWSLNRANGGHSQKMSET